jgi:hypothetical protein
VTTEPASPADWRIAAVVAPVAAAAFGAAVFWAADTAPSTAAPTAAPAAVPAGGLAGSHTAPGDSSGFAITSASERRRVHRELVVAQHRRELAALRRRLDDVRRAGRSARHALQYVPPPVAVAVPAAPAAVPAVAAPAVAAPAVAAPPVQATTGGSGAVR